MGLSIAEQHKRRDEHREAMKYLINYLKENGLFDLQGTPKQNVKDYFEANVRGYRHGKNTYLRLARYMTVNLNTMPYNIVDLKGYGRKSNKIKTPKRVTSKKQSSKSFYSSREWREVRVKALVKNGRKCCLCGRAPKDGIILHVDHIKPRSNYPELELSLSNLQILCEDCNLGKSNHYEEDWR